MTQKCKLKTRMLAIVAAFLMFMIAFPCVAEGISPEAAKAVGSWPAQTLLAALAMGAMVFAHKSWKVTMEVTEKQLEHQVETNKIVTELTLELKRANDETERTNVLLKERPCIIPHEH